jgi:hypothetical protein
MTWSLPQLLASLHDDIEQRLAIVRKTLAHSDAKGDASEAVWLELFQTYLPRRYSALKAYVVDSKGDFSQQIDAVIFDSQYSPFIFNYQGQVVIPAESVYAVFEAKQAINAARLAYAHEKIASVRNLYRTSLPIPTASGILPPKPLHAIIGGLVTLESDWNPPLGNSLADALNTGDATNRVDVGCVAAHGMFSCDPDGRYSFAPRGKPATAFLLELIARLQTIATVPMIDVRAYAQWLSR